jgi:hypothetical protein
VEEAGKKLSMLDCKTRWTFEASSRLYLDEIKGAERPPQHLPYVTKLVSNTSHLWEVKNANLYIDLF